MVKGLLIRQAFYVVDVALALLVALVIYFIADRQLESRAPTANPVDAAPTDQSSAVAMTRVGPLSDYDVIMSNGLFGPAGQASVPGAPQAEEAAFVPPPPTLTLHATAASDEPGDPLATAVIENSAAPTVQKIATYYHDQPVTENLYLKEVYPRKVVLENRKENSVSELVMADASKEPSPGTLAAMARGQVRRPTRLTGAPDTISLKRDEVAEELATYDYADVVNTLNPTMAEDANGNVTGITSDNFASIPLAASVGLQNGDVVNTVNGIKIDSDQKLIEIFNKFQNASTFRLGVTRNGTPVMLTLKLE